MQRQKAPESGGPGSGGRSNSCRRHGPHSGLNQDSGLGSTVRARPQWLRHSPGFTLGNWKKARERPGESSWGREGTLEGRPRLQLLRLRPSTFCRNAGIWLECVRVCVWDRVYMNGNFPLCGSPSLLPGSSRQGTWVSSSGCLNCFSAHDRCVAPTPCHWHQLILLMSLAPGPALALGWFHHLQNVSPLLPVATLAISVSSLANSLLQVSQDFSHP